MVQSFGARLRAERERKQVALSAIADETKIKQSLLEDLEQDDLSCWPEGLFRRAYVRSYARAIGLDPEAVVCEFLQQYPEPVEPDPSETEPPIRSFLKSPLAAMSALLGRKPRNAPQRTDTTASPASRASRPAAIPAVPADVPAMPVPPSSPPEPEAPAARMSERNERDCQGIAGVSTRLGRIADRRGLPPLLTEAIQALDAVGLVVWCWDSGIGALRATVVNGYPEETATRLPAVAADEPNAVAATFRSRETGVVPSGPGVTGAVTVPLMAPVGCVGVLAIELRNGRERDESVRAFAGILAAQLVTLVEPVTLAEAVA